MSQSPIRLLIVDDHAVVRQGLRAFLELQPDIVVAGEAQDARSAALQAAALLPDVVLMDLVLPDSPGPAAIEGVRAAAPSARVLVLTSFADDAQLFAAMQAGAAGYLLKDVDPEALATAIREVQAGRPALHPRVAARLIRHVAAPAGLVDLTGRERDVLRLLAEGLANKEIAVRLHIGEKTVKTHVSSLLAKLGVSDRTQAAVLAIRSGLVR